MEPVPVPSGSNATSRLWRVGGAATHHLRPAGGAVAGRLRAAWSHRAVRVACLRVYEDALAGAVPDFPREMEGRLDAYLAIPAGPRAAGPVATHRSGPMDRDGTIDW